VLLKSDLNCTFDAKKCYIFVGWIVDIMPHTPIPSESPTISRASTMTTIQTVTTLQSKSMGDALFQEYFQSKSFIEINEFMKIQKLVYPGHKCDEDMIELLYFQQGELTPDIANQTIFSKRNSLKSVRELLAQVFQTCKSDTAEDCLRLGNGFYSGDLLLDYSLGFYWYEKSIKRKENGQARFALGVCYYRGDGVDRDAKKAFSQFKKAAKMNHFVSNLYLSRCYRLGLGTEVNLQKSFMNLEIASTEIPDAQYELGESYYHGFYDIQDFKLACECFQKAAENGHIKAKHDLAICYRYGLGIEQDFEISLMWYETAANDGYVPSQNSLAYLYQQGLGDQVRMELAFYWFQQAAISGYESAIFNVGYMYLNGFGVAKNIKAALQCFRRTEEYGPSQHQLGICYASGTGVEMDAHEAFIWFSKAAEQMIPAACNDVALFYELGLGVVVNLQLAVKWYKIAIELGDKSATENLNSLYELYPHFKYENVPDYLWPALVEESSLLDSIDMTYHYNGSI
jgi:TPR repeat protein